MKVWISLLGVAVGALLLCSSRASQLGPVGPQGPVSGSFGLAQLYVAPSYSTNYYPSKTTNCIFLGSTTNGGTSGFCGLTNISSTLYVPDFRQLVLYASCSTTNTTNTATPGLVKVRFVVSKDGGTTWTTTDTNIVQTADGQFTNTLSLTLPLLGTNVTQGSLYLDASWFNAIKVGMVENTDTNGIRPTVGYFVK